MKIAIAGYGVEGQANYAYWSGIPGNDITIVDEKATPDKQIPADAKTLLGAGVFSRLDGFDMVVRTASLAPSKITTNGKVWSSTNEFLEQCPAPIIGVTGTKGKGTTSTMIASILEAAGKTVWLVGNIGIPPLEVLPRIKASDIVVFELSSFQLWDAHKSPHIAVVLPIEPEHLDIHSSFEDYVGAKAHIAQAQTAGDVCVFNPHNDYSRAIGLSNSASKHIEYTTKTDGSVYIEDGYFCHDGKAICLISELQVKGEHNKENACAAITVALQLGVNIEAIGKGIRQFKGLPHRLEFVRTYNGIDFYNDSFSSSPPATLAAARAFTQPEILIVGGINRGGDFDHLAHALGELANIKAIVCIGEYSQNLVAIFNEAGVQAELIDKGTLKTMHEIVAFTTGIAQAGDVIVLSPGCASFDMFKDFYDRGDQFRQEVKALL